MWTDSFQDMPIPHACFVSLTQGLKKMFYLIANILKWEIVSKDSGFLLLLKNRKIGPH